MDQEGDHEVPASPVPGTCCSPAIESNHQLFEWVLPPLVICPFGAHGLILALVARRRTSAPRSRGAADMSVRATRSLKWGVYCCKLRSKIADDNFAGATVPIVSHHCGVRHFCGGMSAFRPPLLHDVRYDEENY